MASKPTQIIRYALVAVLGVAAITGTNLAQEKKLKPQQLLTKHLDSIGSAESRKKVSTRTTAGTVQVVFRLGGQGTLNGQANFLSEANSTRVGMRFPALEYSGEQLAFDGNKVTVGQLSPGVHSPLASFVSENDMLMKEGLLLGSLTTSWALLDSAGRNPKLDDAELKKIDGRSLYEMRYQPRRGGGQIKVWLYFEPETFRHVRTQYKLEVPAMRMTNISDSAELVRYLMIEDFSDFKEVEGVTLPHAYKLDYSIDAPRAASFTSWSYVVQQIIHNGPLERQLFSVQ
jgi:hypothetical protein